MIVNIKEAVARAFQFVKDMYEDSKIENVLLEEVTMPENSSSFWDVTLSFMQPCPPKDITDVFAPKEYMRTYKIIRINTNTGEVISMRDRNL